VAGGRTLMCLAGLFEGARGARHANLGSTPARAG
jgi:hypothetical protein